MLLDKGEIPACGRKVGMLALIRYLLKFYAPVVQRIGHLATNQADVGLIPTGGTSL